MARVNRVPARPPRVSSTVRPANQRTSTNTSSSSGSRRSAQSPTARQEKVGFDQSGVQRRALNIRFAAQSASGRAGSGTVRTTITANGKKSYVVHIPLSLRHKSPHSRYDRLPSSSTRPQDIEDRYRAVNPARYAAGVRGINATVFPLKAGQHELFDGNGEKRGIIGQSNVRLNQGQVKTINGEKHYYAFAVSINTEKLPVSGWIKASAIEVGNDPNFSQNDIKRAQPRPVPQVSGKHSSYKKYVVRNVAPQAFKGKDGKPKYGYMENGKFVSFKVLPGKSKNERFAADDYLRRDGNVINLGFNAAGLSNDTLKTDGKPVVFHRAPPTVKGTTIEIDLYRPKDGNGKKPATKMKFVYGFVETQGQKRWGWMAFDALRPKK